MEYLRSLPISTLKIDRSFVQDMTQVSSSDEIVHSAIRLGASLGMTVVAEGVENEATAKRLGAFGCHLAQGFYYAEPMPAMDVAAWVTQAKRSGMLDS